MALLIPYLRVSTDETQSVASSGQLHAIKLWADNHGHTLTAPEVDEGFSGALGPAQRPGLQKALERCTKVNRRRTKDQPAGVIAYDRTRFCRDSALCGFLQWTAKTNGFQLLTTDGYDSNDGSDQALFANAFQGVFGDLQRRAISSATKKALAARKARNERVGKVPFGFALVPGTKALEPVPEEQATLARIQLIKDQGPSAVAATLNAEGLVNRGKPWTRGNLGYLLKRLA